MPRWKKVVKAEGSIERGIILDSRDVFARERYEQRIDYQLAILTEQYHKNKTVNKAQVKKVVEEFINDVTLILRELEDMKRRAEQEEFRKISNIRNLLLKGAKINSKKIKKELEKFGETLKSNTISGLRSYRRKERRLSRGKAPFGVYSKKIRQEKALERDVARKAGTIVNDTSKEHPLSSEADYLIKSLNKIPDEKTYAQLEERIKLLVKNYEKDLEDFLNIEIDIEIEEARKLHRINHYITFLKMVGGFDDLIKRLNNLKDLAKKWVYQDSIAARKLVRYAKTLNYGLSMLKSSEASTEADFPGIVTKKFFLFGQVPAIYIFNQNRPRPNRGIVLVPGIMTDKRYLVTLGKRLVSQDYVVLSIDMTAHGESKERFRLGRNCEYIQQAVKWLRLNGIKNIGAIGHSAGATSIIFALCGYNTKVENQFYISVTRVIERLNEVVKLSKQNKSGNIEKAIYEGVLFSKEYRNLKEIVLNGFKNMFNGQSRINATVLLAAPLRFQISFPPWMSKVFKITPRLIVKGFGEYIFTKGWASIFKSPEGKKFHPYKLSSRFNEVQLRHMIISDKNEFLNYVKTVKNPFDFINLINFLCDNVKNPDKDTGFFRYYRNFIRKTPKLFIYGLKDKVIKTVRSEIRLELEKHYKDLGETETKMYPNLSHKMNKEGQNFDFESGKMPEMTYKIVTFLNRYLGKGRLI